MADMKYLELTFVGETATGRGLNQQIIMEEQEDNTFKVTEGRVGIRIGAKKPRIYHLPMTQWDYFLETRKSRGWLITKTEKMEKITKVKRSGFKPLTDVEVKEIVEALLSYTNQMMEENFTTKVENISDEMIELGTNILKEMSLGYEKMSVAEFNGNLKRLYAAIPRRIDKLSTLLAKQKTDFVDILEREQDQFNLMVDVVKMTRQFIEPEKTILEANGLTWRIVTPEEEKWIKERMRGQKERYHRAWRIENNATEKRFKDFCQKENLTEENGGISHLFHGSKHEAWWSIITNGLVIDPEKFGASITGKAYGYGTYFAPDANKSLGYTSIRGSKWAKGSSQCGYMGIYKVATGDKRRQYPGTQGCDSSLSWKKLQTIQKDALCTWAESRYSGFMMDEVIVYQDTQDTIEYLIEIS